MIGLISLLKAFSEPDLVFYNLQNLEHYVVVLNLVNNMSYFLVFFSKKTHDFPMCEFL